MSWNGSVDGANTNELESEWRWIFLQLDERVDVLDEDQKTIWISQFFTGGIFLRYVEEINAELRGREALTENIFRSQKNSIK